MQTGTHHSGRNIFSTFSCQRWVSGRLIGHLQSAVSARENSLPGLERLDGNLFITVTVGDYFKALIEVLAKLLHIVQLDCKLNKLDLGHLDGLFNDLLDFGGFNSLELADDFDLERDLLTELTTLGATESKSKLEDVVRDDGVFGDLDWDAQIESLHSLDFDHVDGKVNNFNWHTGELHRLIHTKEDSLLPAPVGVVLDLELGEDNRSRNAFEDLFRLADDDSSLHLVSSFATASAFTTGELPWVFTTTVVLHKLLLHFLELTPWNFTILAFDSHLFEEALHHVLPGTVRTMATVTMTVAMTTVTLATVSLPGAIRFLLLFLSLSSFFVKDSNHHRRSLTSISDLEEGVIVTEVLFALGAVVEVLANSALVADSCDGCFAAAVTFDVGVLDLGILGLLFIVVTGLFHKLVKDSGDGFLKLGLDKALDGFVGHVLGSIASTLSFFTLFLTFPVVVLIVTEIGLNLNRLGLEVQLRNDRRLLGGGNILFNFLSEGHLLDWLLDRHGLINDGLNRLGLFDLLGDSFNWSSGLDIKQLDVEFDLLVGREGKGVSHLEIRVVFYSDLFVVGVKVVEVYLGGLVNTRFVADFLGLSVELGEGLDVGDAFDNGIVVVVKRNLDLKVGNL